MMLMMVLVCLCVRNFRSYSLTETHVVVMLIIVWSVCVYVPMQALQQLYQNAWVMMLMMVLVCLCVCT